MTLGEVSEVLDYLNQYPTSDEILAAVHEVKPRSKLRSPKEVDKEWYASFGELPQYGMIPDSMPQDFKDAIEYAKELQGKIHKEKS